MAAGDNRATTNEALRADEEASCKVLNCGKEWGGAGAAVACNAAVTGRDGVQAGGTTGVAARNDGATTNKAPRADEEASCGAATRVTE